VIKTYCSANYSVSRQMAIWWITLLWASSNERFQES